MSADVGSRNDIFIYSQEHATPMNFPPIIFLITWTSLGGLERPAWRE